MNDDPPDDDLLRAARGNGHSADGDHARTGPAPGTTPRLSGPVYSVRLKIVAALVALVSVAAMSWLYIVMVDDDGTTSGTDTSEGIVAVQPAEGSQVLQQAIVGVDLAAGWDGSLTINGEPIPESDLTRSVRARQAPDETGEDGPPAAEGTQDRLEFVPGPDRVMPQLPEGQVCVNARVWPRADGPGPASRSRTWCFTVV